MHPSLLVLLLVLLLSVCPCLVVISIVDLAIARGVCGDWQAPPHRVKAVLVLEEVCGRA